MKKLGIIGTAFAALFALHLGTATPAAAAEGDTTMGSLRQLAEETAQRLAGETLEPHEINNIERRRKLFGQPGLVTYVVLMSNSGQPIKYLTVDGKCTSGGKRLIPGDRLVSGDRGEAYGDFVMEAPSADGTFGSSSPYIYCFTTEGVYVQWNGKYYVSSQPIELQIKPLVIDIDDRVTGQ